MDSSHYHDNEEVLQQQEEDNQDQVQNQEEELSSTLSYHEHSPGIILFDHINLTQSNSDTLLSTLSSLSTKSMSMNLNAPKQGNHGGSKLASIDEVDWREELAEFYSARGLSDKLSQLDAILETWKGREGHMMETLYNKYKEPIPEELEYHINRQKQTSVSTTTNSVKIPRKTMS